MKKFRKISAALLAVVLLLVTAGSAGADTVKESPENHWAMEETKLLRRHFPGYRVADMCEEYLLDDRVPRLYLSCIIHGQESYEQSGVTLDFSQSLLGQDWHHPLDPTGDIFGWTWSVENGIFAVKDSDKNASVIPHPPADDFLTREECVTVLYRYLLYRERVHKDGRVPESGYAEIPEQYRDKEQISAFARDAMEWAIETGVLCGRTKTQLVPKAPVTKGELAAMIHRAFPDLYVDF